MVAGIFQGIGEQVADNLGDALAVNNGDKARLRDNDIEGDATLLHGRGKSLSDSLNQFGNVVLAIVEFQSLLLHLVEIEKLVDELKEPVGVAVNHLQGIVPGHLPHVCLKWPDDERHGGAYLVGYHGEEAQPELTLLNLSLLAHAPQLPGMLTLGLAQAVLHHHIYNGAKEEEIEYTGWPRPPEGRMDNNAQTCLVGTPQAVVIGGLNTEDILACRDVGIGGLVLRANVNPVGIEALEHVGILVLRG